MNEYICCICGATISAEIVAKRHYSFPSRPMPEPHRMVCSNPACKLERQRRENQYQKASQAGNAAMKERGIYTSPQRVAKIAKSNRDNPRRAKKR